jgi:hypothetical protein
VCRVKYSARSLQFYRQPASSVLLLGNNSLGFQLVFHSSQVAWIWITKAEEKRKYLLIVAIQITPRDKNDIGDWSVLQDS